MALAGGSVSFRPRPTRSLRMTPTPASHDSAEAESPAFLHAVAELAQRRAVVATRAVYNLKGDKLLDSGASLDAARVDTLMAQPLAMRLDECLATESAIDATMVIENWR